jgi:hypothetical protein
MIFSFGTGISGGEPCLNRNFIVPVRFGGLKMNKLQIQKFLHQILCSSGTVVAILKAGLMTFSTTCYFFFFFLLLFDIIFDQFLLT